MESPGESVAKSIKTVNLNVDERDVLREKRSTSKQHAWTSRVSNRLSIGPAGFNTSKLLVNTLQPTFRLEPRKRPNIEFMNNTLRRVVDTACQNRPLERFIISRARRFCSSIAREIQMQVTCEEYDRYRVVVKVIMIEQANQTGVSKLAFIWDTDKDVWTNYVKETPLFTLNATVCAVYWE